MSNTIFDLLDRIQKKPGMYLGYPSVTSLFMFLNGYGIARGELDINLTAEEEVFYEQFQPWLQRKLQIKSMTSWDKLIMLSCNDEKTGFEQFFDLLAEFKQKKIDALYTSASSSSKDLSYVREAAEAVTSFSSNNPSGS